jgi:hypothetical protein
MTRSTVYTGEVIIFKNNAGRWGWRWPYGMISNKSWATKEYAAKVAKRNGFAWKFEYESAQQKWRGTKF